MECWHKFDENFKPLEPKTQNQDATSHNADNSQANNMTSTVAPTQANIYQAHRDQLLIPQ